MVGGATAGIPIAGKLALNRILGQAARSAGGASVAAAAADTEVSLAGGQGAGGVFDKLGPWARDALTKPEPGVFEQTLGGSCGAACGQIVTNGARTEADLLATAGGQEWTDPAGLARALGAGWKSKFFDTGTEAIEQAEKGAMIARLQAPRLPAHFVVTTPLGAGRFLVQDPGGGVSYRVSASWIDQYVSAGVFR